MQDRESEAASGLPVYRGLRFRVAALLALSLLPLGLVTILQTRALTEEAQSRSEMTLLAHAEHATSSARQAAERALGAIEALTVALRILGDDPDACTDYLEQYIQTTDRFTFIGLIEADGVMRCASAGRGTDYSQNPIFLRSVAEPRLEATRIDDPDVSTEPVLNITRPLGTPEGLQGFISVSIPLTYIDDLQDPLSGERPLSLATFNRHGTILTSEVQDEGDVLLPRNLPLAALSNTRPHTFRMTDLGGIERRFAVTPLIPTVLYALTAWPVEARDMTVAGIRVPPALLPILMFAASIGVAYLAVDRLVVRHVADLRRMMQAFARRRALPPRHKRNALSTELDELEQGFIEMALDLSNDEARMEDALREKNVLLKEIHHRVKNNLQLISSIMNMQIRAASQKETVRVLRRLQERVLGLATVHRNLYQTDDLSRTDAGRLLRDLFEQLLSMAPENRESIDYTGHFEEVILYPDQALPLSLLASELGTNALRHASVADGGKGIIEVALRRVGDEEAELVCENSVAPDARIEPTSGGLGSRLIRAFSSQLGGKPQTVTENGRHRVTLRFRVESFSQVPEDY